VLTLALSFTGYLLPWDQLAYWAVTIGANIAGSPDELAHALGLPPAFNVGGLQKETLLGASTVGQQALTRFYLLHVVVVLAFVPFLDREKEPLGVWFSGRRGLATTIVSAVYGAVTAVLAVVVPVRYGWLRDWYPEISQLAIIACNPGSLLAVAYGIWCFVVMKATRSTRMGAIALLTCTLVGFAILTYVGTYLRGPNWAFYWSQADWPLH